jgi:glycosyltransferase involved in cell wall biosynthesis
MHQAISSTVSCVDGLICHHEPDVEFLQKEEKISLPIIFLPFYIDSEYFKSKTSFEQRANRVLFRGKAPQYFTENTYNKRRELLDILSKCKNVDLFQLKENLLFTNPVEAVEAYVGELNSYRMLLNLPSIAPTLTVRPFEIMGCGGLLLQDKVNGDKSNELFQDWKHLVYYDSENPEELLSKIEYLIENPDIAKNIAEQGYKLCHKKHTIECRVQEILAWIDSSLEVTSDTTKVEYTNKEAKASIPQKQAVETRKLKARIIIDGVFFQLYKTGIARVWKSLLEEWADNGFAKHIVVLDRARTAPAIAGIRYRPVPPYDYDRTDADREMLQQVCDEEGADLFISSYYTTPLSTPSVFMAHDMIPELVGADLNHPMWREKHYGIQHASAYITVSENTARDLVKFFPDISLDSVTVAKNGINHNTFSPASSEHINRFKTKYAISKPYFILVGAGGGYKNTILFFKAFAQLYTKQGFEIVCTGSGSLLETEFRNYTSGSVVYRTHLTSFMGMK